MCTLLGIIIDFIFSKEFLHDVIGSLLGFVIGVFWSELQFKRKVGKHRIAVRQGFLDSFDSVSRLVAQSIEQLEGVYKPNAAGVPNYTLDSISLVRLIDRADGVMPPKLLRDIDGLRYQIGHIENKMQMLYSIAAYQGINAAVAHPEFNSVLQHLKLASGWISEMRKEVEAITRFYDAADKA